MTHNAVWYADWYSKNKIKKQLQNEEWLNKHPGWKKKHNREYYRRRIMTKETMFALAQRMVADGGDEMAEANGMELAEQVVAHKKEMESLHRDILGILQHDFAEDCQECAVAQTRYWARLKNWAERRIKARDNEIKEIKKNKDKHCLRIS